MGKKIGPYVVETEIGAGGMAVVYKAQQPSLERWVAVKELRADLAKDKSLITRFEREAKYVAALAHQNIVHIYDFITRANAMYIVMEYVDGIDLHSLLRSSRRLPPDVAAIVALQAARALEYAHFRGVIHRDFKPSNLMITRHGDVKLMDFGIARDTTYEDNILTRPGIALGTPAYMSPEQILGERVDVRSDIFSFGIVLYQMVTGSKPFAEDDTRSVMNHILHEPYRMPRAFYPDIPYRLQRIIRKCLKKRPSDRYQHTEALRRDLEELVARQVRVNYNGRLVMYLRHVNLVDEAAAKAYAGVEQMTSTAQRTIDAGGVDGYVAVLRPALQMHAAALFLMSMWAAWVAVAHVGSALDNLSTAAPVYKSSVSDSPALLLAPGPHPIKSSRNRDNPSAHPDAHATPG